MHNSTHRSRRRNVLGALFAATVLAGSSAHSVAADAAKEIHIGYQKYGTLTLLKARGTLDKRLADQGITVKWNEFPSGPVLLEGLNVGSVDFGTVGEAPPIFAQAAGADLVYVGNEPPAPAAEAIVVPKGSAIQKLQDLRGKRIALNKGSNVHYLLVKALEKAGIAYTEIQPIYLSPADARAAFERGSVDAWVIWDPFLAAAEKQLNARVLADGKGLVDNHQFYLASRSFAQTHADWVRIIVEELNKADDWGRSNPNEVAKLLSAQIGLDADVLLLAANRFSYGAQAISPAVLTQQQKIADAFTNLRLIPKSINVHDAVLAQK